MKAGAWTGTMTQAETLAPGRDPVADQLRISPDRRRARRWRVPERFRRVLQTGRGVAPAEGVSREETMDRRVLFATALLALGASTTATVAQEATPTSATFADTLGLPELAVTDNGEGLEGLPAETEAGRYLVTLTNNDDDNPEGNISFIQLTEGLTVDDFGAAFVPATPVEGEEAPVPALEALYDAYIAGGPSASAAGQSAQAIVDLLPGDYAVWNEDFENPVAAPLTVTGEMPADLPQPEADLTFREVKTEQGYDFELSGEPTAGAATIEVVNDADQPHHVVFIKSPVELSEEQVMQLLMLDPESGATPPPGLPSFEEFTFPHYVPVQSSGTTQWHAVNLEPGYYVAVCFVEDPTKENIPHAFEGMIEIFTVGDA
jgi:hypothetical protein